MTSLLYEKIPERLLESTDELIRKKLLSFDGTVVVPTEKAMITVDAARSVMNFNSILNSMNYRMIINLWHRLIEVSKKRNVHLNVIFKNLDDKLLQYLTDELDKAVSAKQERDAIENLTT
jgi:predicted transcriptional regulator